MRTLATLVIALALVGCDSAPSSSHIDRYVAYDTYIPAERRAEAAEWITRTVAAANPQSDEEPEDNIAQAQKTAEALFGKRTIGLNVCSNGSWTFVPYDELGEADRKSCDEYLGSTAARPAP